MATVWHSTLFYFRRDGSMIDEQQRSANQYEHLNLVLGFFPRAESKTQFLTGLSVGMLGFLLATIDLSHHWSWLIFSLGVVAAVVLFAALIRLYSASYPNLAGGEQSLIYFREIAKLREAAFIDKVAALTEEGLFKDLAAQTWRNAKILGDKYNALKDAHTLVLSALPFWLFASALAIALKQNPKLIIP